MEDEQKGAEDAAAGSGSGAGTSDQQAAVAALDGNDLEAFRRLLRAGRVDPRHRYGKPHFGTLLEIAARRAHGRDFVKELLAHVKPNVNVIVPEPVHHAAKRGHADVLAALLADKRTKANAHDSEGRTALHYACMHVAAARVRQYESCVKMLMGRFSAADINRADAHGFSAIHAAARYKPRRSSTRDGPSEGAGAGPGTGSTDEETWEARRRLVRVMLELGRDVLDLDSARALGRTAREDLLQRFPELERRLPAGADALRADPHSALATALRDGRVAVFRALLQETDADGNPALDPNHWFGAPLHATCLELACKKRDAHEFAEALLAAGADPNLPNKLDEKFPIHVACERGHHRQLSALLEGCAATDVNARDKMGYTALHYVVEKWNNVSNEKRKCLDLLVEQKQLDINKKNNRGCTAFMLAVHYKIKYAIKLILNKCDSLDLKVEVGDKTLGDVIKDAFPEFKNDVDRLQGTPQQQHETEWFDLLQETRENEFVERLRSCPRPPDLSMNDRQFTLLQRAARYGMEKAVKILLEKDADPNEVLRGDKTTASNLSPPGVLAAFHRHHGVLKIFLEHSSFDVNAVDAKGNSALHYAAREDADIDIVVLLLRMGANTQIRNKLGKPPLGKSQIESLLDKSVYTNRKNPLDEDYEVFLDYRLLAPGRGEERKPITGAQEYESVPQSENVESALENDTLESEMHFLNLMRQDDDLCSLLDHPVPRSFLELKWSRVRPLAYFNFGVYVAFVVFLNIFIISGKSMILQSSATLTNSTLTNFTQEQENSTGLENDVESSSSWTFSLALAWISFVISLMLWLLLCLREAIQFIFDEQKYMSSTENYLDWLVLLCSLVALGMPLLSPENSLLSTINVLTIMFSCAELLMLLGRLSQFAKYVEMLRVVLCGYILPLMSYCVVIIAFGLSFHTLFHESQGVDEGEGDASDFNVWYMSIVKALVMMTGELEFGSYPDRSLVSVALFVLFVLLVTVVLLNLLIGLAVSDTARIEATAEQLRLRTRVELVLLAESILLHMHNAHRPLLRKASALLLRRRLQSALLFPWRRADGRRAWVRPNQKAELVLPEEDGAETRREVARELLDRATQIISQRSGRCAAAASAVSLADVSAKLDLVLQLVGGRGGAGVGAVAGPGDAEGEGDARARAPLRHEDSDASTSGSRDPSPSDPRYSSVFAEGDDGQRLATWPHPSTGE